MQKVKSLILIAYALSFVMLTQLFAYGKENPSSEQQKINSAIEIIKQYGYKENISILEGNNYTHKAVNIVFKDLSEVNYSYRNFYAITATDNNEDLYILINNNLKSSGIKALACLILHESNHCRENIPDSVSEEVVSFSKETIFYIRLLSDDNSLQYKTDDRLIARLNKLKKIYDDTIRVYITSNTNYVNYLKIK